MGRIKCLDCYRLQKCGDDIYYCPFRDIEPCIVRREKLAKEVVLEDVNTLNNAVTKMLCDK